MSFKQKREVFRKKKKQTGMHHRLDKTASTFVSYFHGEYVIKGEKERRKGNAWRFV